MLKTALLNRVSKNRRILEEEVLHQINWEKYCKLATRGGALLGRSVAHYFLIALHSLPLTRL